MTLKLNQPSGISHMFCALVAAGLLAPASSGEIDLPYELGELKTRDNKTYVGAKIVGTDAIGVKITHAAGSARIPYARLPRELADKFDRDRDAARELREKEAVQTAAYERAVDKGLRENRENREHKSGEEPMPAITGPGIEEPKGEIGQDPGRNPEAADPDAKTRRIAYLRSYIKSQESAIEEADKKIAKLHGKAADIYSRARNRYYDENGSLTEGNNEVTNEVVRRRADRKIKQVDEERTKIREASRMISRAMDEIRKLERQQ